MRKAGQDWHAIYPARVILQVEERRKEKEEEAALFPADWILACVGEEMPTQRATTHDDVEKKENESKEKEEENVNTRWSRAACWSSDRDITATKLDTKLMLERQRLNMAPFISVRAMARS
uniref:Uncharacterized protein n=1 Tax=Vespula pensylvanica TaxID=30213 RepID=A0A834U9S3_VESPE|nr:hypothetical protein H0235_009141 [Vespula pensylvanica]